MKKIDAVIIGAGPAGLAASIRLYSKGITNIILFERSSYPGGILKQCIHTGFGLEYYKEDLTGPEYAFKMNKTFINYNIPVKLNTSVIDINKNKTITTSSYQEGIRQYKAKSIIIAAGCRERTRENLEIPGTRPAGVFSAGQAQKLININNLKIGKNVIIQGTGDIGLIMARRLSIEGYNVIKVFERLPYLSGLIRNKVQCTDDFDIPVEFNTQICEITGRDRVTGVFAEKLNVNQNQLNRKKTFYKCDTVLFSVGLIPETELLKKAGAGLINNFKPIVNSKFETTVRGIFCCGNSLHINDLADNASKEGELTANFVMEYLNNKNTFKNDSTDELPYKQTNNDKKYNADFFKNIKNQKICIVCPKGCLVSKTKAGCRKGTDFYKNETACKKRRLTTTLNCKYKGKIKNIPIISEKEIDIKAFRIIKIKLKKVITINENRFKIKHDGTDFYFNTVDL